MRNKTVKLATGLAEQGQVSKSTHLSHSRISGAAYGNVVITL